MISHAKSACAANVNPGGVFSPSLLSLLFPPPYSSAFGMLPLRPALHFAQNHLLTPVPSSAPSSKVAPARPSRFLIKDLLRDDCQGLGHKATTRGTAPQAPACPVRSRKRKIRTSKEPPTTAEKKRKLTEPAIRLQAVKEKEPSLLPPDLSNCLPSGEATLLDGVRVEMDEEWANLWREFDKVQTEMIVTRAGRRFYPVVKVRLEGCDPSLFYYVMLDVVPVDGCRYQYRYCKSRWKNAGKADPPPSYCLFLHPDSPFTGGTHKTSAISVQFDKAKLTNFPQTNESSCQKNHVRIHVLALDQRHPRIERFTSAELQHFLVEHPHLYRTFDLPHTKFFAVTAYQNGLVKQLKIKYNPFAKGFRDKEDIGHIDSAREERRVADGNRQPSVAEAISTANCRAASSAEIYRRLANDILYYNSIGHTTLPPKVTGSS